MEERDARHEGREKARSKYKPDKIRRLLIAEAPPDDHDRYFYFEHVTARDYLFMETIHAIYRREYPEISIGDKPRGKLEDQKPNTEEPCNGKAEFMGLFKEDGFHLIDT